MHTRSSKVLPDILKDSFCINTMKVNGVQMCTVKKKKLLEYGLQYNTISVFLLQNVMFNHLPFFENCFEVNHTAILFSVVILTFILCHSLCST